MGKVTIRHEGGKLRQELKIGIHHLVADEPVEQGGEDGGPSPFEFLSAALASCMAITLRMYSQRKMWPLENAEIEVSIIKEKGLNRFESKIHLVGALDGEQKQRLLEIASRCPVHKLLTGKIEINAELVDTKI